MGQEAELRSVPASVLLADEVNRLPGGATATLWGSGDGPARVRSWDSQTVEPLEISRASMLWYRVRRLFGWRDPAERYMVSLALEESPNGDIALIGWRQKNQRVEIPAAQIAVLIEMLSSTRNRAS